MNYELFFCLGVFLCIIALFPVKVSNELISKIISLILLLFSAYLLSSRGVDAGSDTIKYYKSYYELSLINGFSFSGLYNAFSPNGMPLIEPFFGVLNYIFASILAVKFQYFLFFYSFFILSILFFSYKRMVDNYIFCFSLFLVSFSFVFLYGNAIRQAGAVSFVMLAISYLCDNKNKKFYFYCLIGFLFHYFAFVFLMLPLINKLDLKYKFIIFSIVIIVSLSGVLSFLTQFIPIDFIRYKAEYYLNKSVYLNASFFVGFFVLGVSFILRTYVQSVSFNKILNIYFSLLIVTSLFLLSEVAYERFSFYRFVFEPVVIITIYSVSKFNIKPVIKVFIAFLAMLYFYFLVYGNSSVIYVFNIKG